MGSPESEDRGWNALDLEILSWDGDVQSAESHSDGQGCIRIIIGAAKSVLRPDVLASIPLSQPPENQFYCVANNWRIQDQGKRRPRSVWVAEARVTAPCAWER